MRRLALFSDVHANVPALEAVLADIEACAVQEVYCLGDLVGYGPDPAGVVRMIRALGIPTIRGNYDDGIGNRRGQCGCYYVTEQAKADGAESYAYTDAMLDDRDHTWLASLPDDIRLDEGDARILLAHGSPRKINEYLLPDRSDAQLARLAGEAAADVVCVGHIHIPYHRSMLSTDGPGTVHYISSGSVGKPKDGDPRAGWVELVLGTLDEVRAVAPDDESLGPAGTTSVVVGAVVHRVAYDVEAVAREVLGTGLPSRFADALRTA